MENEMSKSANELWLYAMNTSEFFHAHIEPMVAEAKKELLKGTYDVKDMVRGCYWVATKIESAYKRAVPDWREYLETANEYGMVTGKDLTALAIRLEKYGYEMAKFEIDKAKKGGK